MFRDLDEKIIRLKALPVQYLCVGKEIAPTTGTPHLQGYLYFADPIRMSTLKKFDAEASWRPQKGSDLQAEVYCKMEGDWFEQGEKPSQGKRSDLEAVAVKVRNGASLKEVALENPGVYVRWSKGLKDLKAQLTTTTERSDKPHVSWFWGGTGTGKTRTAVDCSSFYIKNNTKWWDGYSQEKRVIIDDFDEESWNFRYLLTLLDRYKMLVEYKGGSMQFNSPEIIVTCEYPPNQIWRGTKLAQIERRIDVIREFVSQSVTEVPAQK